MNDTSGANERRKIKELVAMVADVIVEAPDTATLVLFTGNERLDYEAGHFLTIDPHQFEGLERFIAFLEDLKGRKEPPRAYSMCSAPHESHLAITVKEERYVSGVTKYPPLLSPLLVKRIGKGARVLITGFTGPYTLKPEIASSNEFLVHVCAGSGSVPNFAILKHALEQYPKLRHLFVYSNRTWEDVIFRAQLDELARTHPDRLAIVHALTREERTAGLPPGIRRGRVTTDLLREVLPATDARHFFVCGPAISAWDRAVARDKGVEPQPRFLESVLSSLAELGIPKAHITRESYG